MLIFIVGKNRVFLNHVSKWLEETIFIAPGIYNREIEIDIKLSRKKLSVFRISKKINKFSTIKLRTVWIVFMTWDKYGHYYLNFWKQKVVPNFVQQLSSLMLGEPELAITIASSTMLTSAWRNRAAASEKQ